MADPETLSASPGRQPVRQRDRAFGYGMPKALVVEQTTGRPLAVTARAPTEPQKAPARTTSTGGAAVGEGTGAWARVGVGVAVARRLDVGADALVDGDGVARRETDTAADGEADTGATAEVSDGDAVRRAVRALLVAGAGTIARAGDVGAREGPLIAVMGSGTGCCDSGAISATAVTTSTASTPPPIHSAVRRRPASSAAAGSTGSGGT